MTEISTIEEGNMVDLPQDILEKLNKKKIDPPYFFQISTRTGLKSYVGVRQFTSQKDTIEIPIWLSNQLSIFGNEIITLQLIENIPKGKYIKLRPETEDFFDVPEYESCLEAKLSLFPLLYQGMTIVVNIIDKKYSIKIQDIDMDWENFDFEKGTSSLELNVIDVINTDINVDITNIFLEKKLQEEKKLQKELAQKEESSKNITGSFSGKGRVLSDTASDSSVKTIDEIRKARLEKLGFNFEYRKKNTIIPPISNEDDSDLVV